MVNLLSGTHVLSDSGLGTVKMSVIHYQLCKEASRNPTTLSNSMQTTPVLTFSVNFLQQKCTFLW